MMILWIWLFPFVTSDTFWKSVLEGEDVWMRHDVVVDPLKVSHHFGILTFGRICR